MTKLCRAIFKDENERTNWLRKLTYKFAVNSNEMACRKRGRPGLDPVVYNTDFIMPGADKKFIFKNLYLMVYE